MTPDDYLQALREKLKSFSHTDRAVLVEEISSHIESGEEDPKLGKDPGQRREKLMAELGSPGDMVKGFKMIYQPDGLIDFLLVAIPLLINTSLNLLLVRLMSTYPWADVRIVILVYLLIMAVGLWRRSRLLTLYWLPRLTVQILGVVLFTGAFAYYGRVQTVSLTILFAVLLFLLGRLVWQTRHDILIIIYALLPLIIGVLSILNANILRSQMSLLDISTYTILDKIPFLGLVDYGMLALFFFGTKRDIRWAAYMVNAVLIGSFISQPNFFLWIILPLAIVSFGWLMDRYKRHQLRFAS